MSLKSMPRCPGCQPFNSGSPWSKNWPPRAFRRSISKFLSVLKIPEILNTVARQILLHNRKCTHIDPAPHHGITLLLSKPLPYMVITLYLHIWAYLLAIKSVSIHNRTRFSCNDLASILKQVEHIFQTKE